MVFTIIMRKRLFQLVSVVLILTGIILVATALKDIYLVEKKTNLSLAQAKELVHHESGLKKEIPKNETELLDISFEKGEVIGILNIPKLDAELPIIEGTDEEELEKGVGHYSNTVFPGQPDQILLSGHRDTVFRKLGDLENGDIFHVEMPYGDFYYEIIGSQIVDADDTTVIRSTAPDEILTVSTCYPFYFIGDAPDRYVLTAKRIESPESI